MIGRPVGERERAHAADPEAPEDRDDHALAAIPAPRPAAARVDEERLPLRRPHQDRLALAHVEDDEAHEPVRPEGRERGRARAEAEQRDREPGRPPARVRREDQREPARGHRERGRRRHVHDGAGEGGERADDEAQRDEEEPETLEERLGERLPERRHRERQDPARREEARQRDDQEVRGDAERRELAEVEQHHRGDAQLGAGRHGERAPDRPGTPGREPRADPRVEVEEPGRRRERELEPRLPRGSRDRGPGAPRSAAARLFHTRLSRPRRPAARNRPPMMVARSTEGWPPTTAANATSVASARPAASGVGQAEEAEDEERRAGDERDVEARDREDVEDPRLPEVGEQGRRELAALADEEALEEGAGDRRQVGLDRAVDAEPRPEPPGERHGGQALDGPRARGRDVARRPPRGARCSVPGFRNGASARTSPVTRTRSPGSTGGAVP